MDIQKTRIRNIVGGVYDVQKLRIATGNRIVASLRPDAVDTECDEEDTKYLPSILKEYKRITDYYVSKFDGRGSIEKAINPHESEYIKSRLDYDLVTSYKQLLATEEGLTKVVEREVKSHPMWDAFFAGVKGCGPLMSAVCLAYFDPYKARHASSFWRYAGLDVQRDETSGKMRGVGRWYTEERPYISRDGDEQIRKSLTYNPFLKTKLVGVLGSAFLRARDSYYGKVYYDYKNRLDNRPDGLSPIVKHRMATRYAVKMFLRDMWVVWRELEGLEVTKPYEVAKLGHRPHHC